MIKQTREEIVRHLQVSHLCRNYLCTMYFMTFCEENNLLEFLNFHNHFFCVNLICIVIKRLFLDTGLCKEKLHRNYRRLVHFQKLRRVEIIDEYVLFKNSERKRFKASWKKY